MTRGKPLSFDRQEVLNRAMEFFWSRGYEGTGITELLKYLGIQRQSFYNTFKGKQEIFREALILYCETTLKRPTDLLDRPGNPIKNVEQVLQMWEGMIEREDHLGCMLGNSIAEFGSHDDEMCKLMKRNLQRMEDAFFRTFKRAANEGMLPEGKNPRTLARSFVAISQGLALLLKLGIEKAALKDVLTTARQLIAT